MIDRAYVERMARYNRWQNENVYSVADRLSDDERRRVRGAFCGSIHKTFNHLLWGDQIRMSRLTGLARPPVGIAESVRSMRTGRLEGGTGPFRWHDHRLGRRHRPVVARRDHTYYSRDERD